MVMFYVNEFSCMYVYHVCVWCPRKSEEGVRVLDLKLWMVESRHVGGCWDLNLSPLQEQQVPITIEPLSSLHFMEILKERLHIIFCVKLEIINEVS